MMKIIVDRYKSTRDATLSRVKVFSTNGHLLFECFGLEDEYRAVKIKGKTRIPNAEYLIGVRTAGSFSPRYSRRFPDMHNEPDGTENGRPRGMLHVLDVPNFKFIYIHIGNFERDTAGCLLIGEQRDEEKMEIYRSSPAYRKLYPLVIAAAEAGELKIEFIDNDREGPHQ